MGMPRLGPWVCAGLLWAAQPALAQPDLAEEAEASSAAGRPLQALPPQSFPFVTLDQTRFFSDSLYGKRLNAELEAKQIELARENRLIEADLAEREKVLTEQRASLSPADFRQLADEFNAEVGRHRLEQAQKEREIYQNHEMERAVFQDLANQALAGLLRERGALAIIAEEAIVLGFIEIDITEDAVARLDALVGDAVELPRPGPSEEGQSEGEETDAPEPTAPGGIDPTTPSETAPTTAPNSGATTSQGATAP